MGGCKAIISPTVVQLIESFWNKQLGGYEADSWVVSAPPAGWLWGSLLSVGSVTWVVVVITRMVVRLSVGWLLSDGVGGCRKTVWFIVF